jgi:hypothetical protein
VQSVLLKAQFDNVNQISHGKKKVVWRLLHKDPQIHQKPKNNKIKIEEQNKTKKKRKWNEGFVFRPRFSARNLEFGDPFGVWVPRLPRLPRIFTLHFCAEKKKKKKKNCVIRKTKPSYYK